MTNLIQLGKTDIKVQPLGMGAWQWGDRLFWQYGTTHNDDDIRQSFLTAQQAGINFYDTAEVYGPGTSEKMLGKFIRETKAEVFVATKCFPYPWRLTKGALSRALRSSLKRMNRVDLYQMHWPTPLVKVESWMDAMADAVQAGLIRAIGVSNYNLAQTQRAVEALSKRGLTLTANQVHYSLIERTPDKSGLTDYCRQNGITIIAYSPLEMGMLSGKYDANNLPKGTRSRRYTRQRLISFQPLIDQVKAVAQERNKTPSQVALNWLICRGTLPIPGAKNAKQAQDNAGALGWELTPTEVETLTAASDKI
jgi:aryl-alcohol dehydrogenase-like predicted oxidoreductase